MPQIPENSAPAESFFDRYAVLDERQFTSADVCAVVGINAKQLEHAIDPKRSTPVLSISTHDLARVKGRRRLFTGDDCLKINTLFVANRIGFPQRFANTLANLVSNRAAGLMAGIDLTPKLHFAAWPMKSGDWVHQPLYEGMREEPKLPLAYQIIAVDELIDQTIRKLLAVVADEKLPDFQVPDPKPEASPWSPENDFFLAWTKDEQGRNTRVGLTFEETEFFEKQTLESLQNSLPPSEMREATKRYNELLEKHEAARFARLSLNSKKGASFE